MTRAWLSVLTLAAFLGRAQDFPSPPGRGLGEGAQPRTASEPKNAEPKNAEQKNAEQKNAEQKNAEPKNAEQKNAEPKNAEQKLAQPKNAEQKNAEPKNAEPKNAEPKLAQPKSGVTKRKPLDAPDAPSALKVLAFNVLFKGADDSKSLRAVREEDADVVCLTELTPTFVKAFEADATLAKTYPHRVFAPQLGTWGVGFASKLPLSNVQTFGVAPIKLPAMEANVPFAGAPVTLTCVHLVPPGGKDGVTLETLAKTELVREKQAGTLTARYAKLTTPSILLGDFNEEPGGKTLRALAKAGWERGCLLPDSSCTPTFPGAVVSWPAVFTIDHVLARGLAFESTQTVRAGGSDHYPVAAVLMPKASQK